MDPGRKSRPARDSASRPGPSRSEGRRHGPESRHERPRRPRRPRGPPGPITRAGRLGTVALVVLILLGATPALADGFGLARFRETWAEDHPAPRPPATADHLNIADAQAWRNFDRALTAWEHRAWVAWAKHRDAVERAARAAPAPSTGPVAPVTPSGSCESQVAQAFGSRGLSVSLALYIADRESHCTATAYNPIALENGHASGVFQWLSWGGYGGIWGDVSAACGYGGVSAFSMSANITVSAKFVAGQCEKPWNGGGWWPWGF